MSAEEWQFHESEFSLAVMVPPSGLGSWLKERRPALSQQLEADGRKGEVRLLPALLQVMYGDKGVDAVTTNGALPLHRSILENARANHFLKVLQAFGFGIPRESPRPSSRPTAVGQSLENPIES